MIFIVNNNIHIYLPSTAFRTWCKKSLTIRNPQFEEAIKYGRFVRGIRKNILLYEEDEGCLVVPRGFLRPMLERITETGEALPDIIDDLPDAEKIGITSKIKLRDYQKPFVEEIVRNGSGIAVASPGAGKTECALDAIARIGYRTLWITHTSSLVKQTMERAKTRLSQCSIGKIGQGVFEIGDITVALVQTINRRDVSDISKMFPLVVIDECHHTPSRIFSESLRKFHYRICIGLSATPYRRDKLESLMYNIVGPKIAEIGKSQLVEVGYIVPAQIIQKRTGVKLSGYEYRDILNSLYNSKERLRLVCNDIRKEQQLGNTCIALTNKIDYGRKIVDMLTDMGISASLVFSTETSKESKKGKVKRTTMPKKEREEIISKFISGEIKILVATYNLLSEGFDHKPLNRLFLTTPISDKNRTLLEQVCGRVERSAEGKEDAIVYDYVDEHSLLQYQADMRIGVYENSGMEVSDE